MQPPIGAICGSVLRIKITDSSVTFRMIKTGSVSIHCAVAVAVQPLVVVDWLGSDSVLARCLVEAIISSLLALQMGRHSIVQ
jgi:hypothetical protein